jgi:hypothetical protein
MKVSAVLFLAAGMAAAQNPPEAQFRVKLLSAISTRTSQPGDKVAAQVLEPANYAGDTLEGKVRESKGGKKLSGTASLNFTFDTHHRGGQALMIQSNLVSVINSQGQRDVDEEGRVVKKKSSIGKMALATALGAGVGALAGGAKGAAIGAGAGAAAGLIFIQLAVDGAEVSFAPGSEFLLAVKEVPR